MATIQEQAIEYIREALHFDEATIQEIIDLVPTIPLSPVGQPYCPACESVLCGACGDCHGLDLAINRPPCPHDNDTMGHTCVAWYQAHKAVYTMQRMHEEQE